ncbi:MAG: HEAT repeat domain-containing protein [Thermoleophilia bacterium]|nr:HEAT repeat domain-containing protein [Thermoleophilia bacterium]
MPDSSEMVRQELEGMNQAHFAELWTHALGQLDSPAIGDEDPFIEASKAEPEYAISFLADRLASADSDERRLAASTIEEVGQVTHDVAGRIKTALELFPADESTAWLLSAIQASGDHREIDFVASFAEHEIDDVRDVVASVVSALGWPTRSQKAVVVLLKLATDPNDEVRFSSCWELANWLQNGYEDARIDSLVEAMRSDTDLRIRTIASDLDAA